MLTLSRLNHISIHAIKEVENVDAPYRTWNLKTRLQRTFPRLVFVTPANRSMSDIVFSEGVCAEDLARELVDDTDTTSAESSTDDAVNQLKEVAMDPSQTVCECYLMLP